MDFDVTDVKLHAWVSASFNPLSTCGGMAAAPSWRHGVATALLWCTTAMTQQLHGKSFACGLPQRATVTLQQHYSNIAATPWQCCSNAMTMLWQHHSNAAAMPCQCHVNVMATPQQCHGNATAIPRQCHSMQWQCCGNAMAMLQQCHGNAMAMLW